MRQWRFAYRWVICLGLLFLVACGGNSASQLDPDVIFHDEFAIGQTADWQLEGDANGQTTIVDEQLVINLQAPNTLQYAALTEPTFGDFKLQVDGRILNGDLSNSYGVLFRMQSQEAFYRFEITGDGRYMLEQFNGGEGWNRFVDDWTAHPAIQQGLGVTNRIRIEAIGPEIAVYVNDQLVQQISDNRYVSGQIALDAGTFFLPEWRVAFDNVQVRQP
jgi:hypothetical protein